jgi:hypothetical protein
MEGWIMGDIRTSQFGGIPFGNTSGRPANATGQPYFNGEAGRLELYTTASGWQNIVQETPGVSSITGTYSEQANSGVITISGTNFVSGCYATAIGTNGVQVDAGSTTFNSLVQVIATFTGLSNQYEPYDIKVTNPSNLFGMIPDALYVNASPVWQTSSGSLGTFNEQVSISVSATATDSDSTITYALASGSTLPSGITLNSSTGVISGTLPDITTDTTYNFIINASDGLNTIPRSFSILSVAFPSLEYLVVGGGGASGQARRAGGGAGGMLTGNLALTSTQILVTVGNGGAANNSGQAFSTAENSVLSSFIAYGGGCGAQDNGGSQLANGRNGGSGGGGLGDVAPYGLGGTGVTGQGNSGGSGQGSTAPNYGAGGGGGAGAVGGNGSTTVPGNGGNGLQSSITGTATYYAGGGGGGYYSNTNGQRSSGGLGGGGRGANYNTPGESGVPNTGGGGGGGYNGTGATGDIAGGAGGSGVVVIAYPNTYRAITTIPGTLTYDQPTRSGYRVYRFTAGSGTVTF